VKPYDPRIVIIGNGIAGNSAASAIRSSKNQVAVTIISQEPFPEYSACTLSKKYLSGEMKRDEVFLKAPEDYFREKITPLFGQQVINIDAREKKVILEQEEVRYDKLILAMGGNPMIPPLPGVEKKGIFTLKSLGDADSIFSYSGSKAVVIGAGAIGIEASISLRKRGWNVVLLELLDRVLPTMFDDEKQA